MKIFLPLLALLCLPATALASWAHVPVETLVQESDVIVVGTLRDVSEYTADETDYGRGRIEVREVIWGRVSPGDSLQLRWSNSTHVVCPRVEHQGNANKEGIWLLTGDGETYRADYPGRFVDKSGRKQVERALANSPVVLRSDKYFVGPGEPMTFSVVYRNVSDSERAFPGLAFEGGDLRVSPGSRLAVTVMFDDGEIHGAAGLSGRVVRDSGLAPVNVPPRGEHRLRLDLREMLTATPGENDSYNVTFKFSGLPRTNELDFSYAAPRLPQPATEMRKFIDVSNVRNYRAPVAGLGPLKRAGLVAFIALLLFPFFQRMRVALGRARLARAAHGAQTWQT